MGVSLNETEILSRYCICETLFNKMLISEEIYCKIELTYYGVLNFSVR